MLNQLKREQGFSLIGIIVSVFVISIGLVSILALTSASLKAASLSKDRLIASGLVQEGIELVREIRMSYVEWDNWEWYGALATSTSQNFLVQYDKSSLMSFSEAPLKINTNGLYQYDSGNNTGFYRKITLTKNSSQEVKLLIEVKWQLKGQWYYLTAEERLWKWR